MPIRGIRMGSSGDNNRLIHQSPWIEGPWVTKHNGKYYLQYAGPGTEYKSYADAVYLSENPLGPFVLQEHNPAMYKPEGFAAGAGHGSSFADEYGNFWQIGTMTISQKHMFERRLGLFPVFLDEDGTYYAVTKYGDYPLTIPQNRINRFEDIFPEWMLLTYNKQLTVSSSVDSLPPDNMTDENIRTYWAAASETSTNTLWWIWVIFTMFMPYRSILRNIMPKSGEGKKRFATVTLLNIRLMALPGKCWLTVPPIKPIIHTCTCP